MVLAIPIPRVDVVGAIGDRPASETRPDAWLSIPAINKVFDNATTGTWGSS